MSSHEERQRRIEAAHAKAADYLYDRRVNGVPVRALAKRAGLGEGDMLMVLKAHGYTYQQARKDDTISLMKPYGTTRTPPRGRAAPDIEAMFADARGDHD